AVDCEEDRLHVLAADLAHEPDVGVELLDGGRDRDHLLVGLAPHELGDLRRARSGDEDAVPPGGEAVLGLETLEELEDLLRLLGAVALVGAGLVAARRVRVGRVGAGLRFTLEEVFACRASDVDGADHDRLASASRTAFAAVPATPRWGSA